MIFRLVYQVENKGPDQLKDEFGESDSLEHLKIGTGKLNLNRMRTHKNRINASLPVEVLHTRGISETSKR
uniref:WGS project CBMI000000000 data, contig CS3069_c003295 n=1 Tax=Fusarium clavum TaxID=2594811 RepID=A0A090N5W2_9HYPO|nr:unnamed protein product [Fusarium clavum]